jgi:uncharacterized membrane protein YoaK (UPF0700 family)
MGVPPNTAQGPRWTGPTGHCHNGVLMVLSKGPDRKHRENVILAIALSTVAGAVNGIGFLEVGSFTSHVTGNAAHLGVSLAAQRGTAILSFCALLVAFLCGAFCAGALEEMALRLGRARHALALVMEATVLTAFVAVVSQEGAHSRTLATALLCFAMGIQNALVTNVSGAVVRTTHLTGVMTDMGLEMAHLLAARDRGRSFPKLTLHASIFCGFLLGAVAGPLTHAHVGPLALFGPVALLLGLTVMDALLFWWNTQR